MKSFCFTTDDNILFLKDISERKYDSVFRNPYLAFFKSLHEKYGLKVQMNLFFGNGDFTLEQVSDRYGNEFSENSDWLIFAFHADKEYPAHPYRFADYSKVFGDCSAVNREICRFAGAPCLSDTPTVHYCTASEEGIRALRDCGVRGLFGLFGQNPPSGYSLAPDKAALVSAGISQIQDGITYFNIDLILDRLDITRIPARLEELSQRDFVSVMIHEQYFYPEYRRYQPDYREKAEVAVKYLKEKGFSSVFALEKIVSAFQA